MREVQGKALLQGGVLLVPCQGRLSACGVHVLFGQVLLSVF